jgi:type III pantothenate kinase
MKLLIDAGNTRIKWAFVKNHEWLSNGVLPIEQAAELPKHLPEIYDTKQIWVSNVAGEQVTQCIRNISVWGSCQPRFIVSRDEECGVQNSYTNPAQLGSDRWAALIAAWHLVGQECLVVNCGTAITVDTLNKQGKFVGGLILPGVALMQHSLVAGTAQLTASQGEYALFPLNTADAIFSGAIQASCGAIQRQHDLLINNVAPIVLSGGAARMLLQPYLNKNLANVSLRVVDNLVLQGLLLIAQGANP